MKRTFLVILSISILFILGTAVAQEQGRGNAISPQSPRPRYELHQGEYLLAVNHTMSRQVAMFRFDTETGETMELVSVIDEAGKSTEVWAPIAEPKR
jgi:hypothetical protein